MLVKTEEEAKRGDVWFAPDEEGVDRLHGRDLVTSDEMCTNCRKTFRMRVDFRVNGNHIMKCPHCGHEHCRTITDGKVTDHRWGHRNSDNDVPPADSMWDSQTIAARTTTAARYIRERFFGL